MSVMSRIIKNTATDRRAKGRNRDHYEEIHASFAWSVPVELNMAELCCTRWALNPVTSKKTAIKTHFALGSHKEGLKSAQRESEFTYEQLHRHACALSLRLQNLGIKKGDVVAIVLPQRFETAVAYMAVLQLGAVAMPLSQLFGPQALEFRLNDSEAVAAIGDDSTLAGLMSVRAQCKSVKHWISCELECEHPGVQMLFESLPSESIGFVATKTKADDPAVLIYTSGTTGAPKGAVVPHRALIGNLTGFVASQNWFGFDPWTGVDSQTQVFWSPADWAWTGGLMDALLPTLYFGKTIVANPARFDPLQAFELLAQHRVTHTFLFPTALKAMMKAFPKPSQSFKFKLHACMSAGEAVGDAVYAWCERELGVRVNEMFGQTEVNYIVGNCNRLWPSKPGSMGKGYPGHRVALIDESGNLTKQGEIGEVAVHRRDVHGQLDPVFFLGYFKRADSTAAKYTGDMSDSWCRTGDLAIEDADGYLWYQGRADDMFKSAGYRIGPGEIENCLLKHPAVANAAVVPMPDAERGALVKAYVVLSAQGLHRLGESEDHALNATKKEASKPIDTLGTCQILSSISSLTEAQPATQSLPAQALVAELQAHVKNQLAPYEYPKAIEFINALPMTTTGKVQRRILRLREEDTAVSAGLVAGKKMAT
jgi:acetyl-CoA synthetase